MLMKDATLCFLINEKEKKVLLGMKKIGFGKDKWNGFGGKVEQNETIEQATIREMLEEANVKINKLEKKAELTFLFPDKQEWNQLVHVYITEKWEQEPKESNEMLPKWFNFHEIPYDKMWSDDIHWLPMVLNNQNVKGKFIFDNDCTTIKEMELKEE